MLEKLWLMLVKNWKTTAAAIASGVVWLLNEVFNVGLTADQITLINTVIIGIGLFFAKDGDKTGLKDE